MPKLIIDGNEIEVADGITLIQACEEAGVDVPRFCYHERLSVAGNCRMCLVEVSGMPKPMASCALGVNDLRPGKDGEPPEVRTNSEKVKKAREGVMEFLLINHPLDCPICDQGGECDLQDQAMAFGGDASRFALNKRAVEDKNIGPTVKTIMTRCIHCTRCVRFMTEVAGVEELGATGRGEDVEITTYLQHGMSSELSGNVIDLCPVGALTSKPYAFTARSWELNKTETIDVMDAMGANIRVDSRGREVMRIMPRNHDDVNEEWISDKSRFIWDGLKTQRLDQPYIREDGSLRPASWEDALELVGRKIKQTKPQAIGAIAGQLSSAEEMFALKELLAAHKVKNMDCRPENSWFDPGLGRGSYLFNSSIAAIDEVDALLLVGTDPRTEAAVLNARIRKRWNSGALKIGLIGPQVDLTYGYDYLGAGPDTLKAVSSGDNAFSDILHKAEKPMIIMGGAVLNRDDSAGIVALCAALAKKCGAIDEDKEWGGFNILHHRASQVAGLDLGFVPGKGGKASKEILAGAALGKIELLYLLGEDEFAQNEFSDKCFVVYQGSHGDKGAHLADVILPGAAYTEKEGSYANMEGRVQQTMRAIFPPGQAKEDWAILRALSAYTDHTLPFNALGGLRAALYGQHEAYAAIDAEQSADSADILRLAELDGNVSDKVFEPLIKDFYFTNPIARASAVMAELSALRMANMMGATGTNG